MLSPPVFTLPNTTGHIALITNACNDQIGCVLLQQPAEETTKPIEYRSRSHTNAERRYDKTQRDCLADIQAVILLSLYSEGTRSIVHTDYVSLMWILILLEGYGKIGQRSLQLSKLTSTLSTAQARNFKSPTRYIFYRRLEKTTYPLKTNCSYSQLAQKATTPAYLSLTPIPTMSSR